MKLARALAMPLAALAVILFAFGCSTDRSTGPDAAPSLYGTMDGLNAPVAAGDPVQVAGRVMTTDPATRMLTFLGLPDTAIAAEDCEILLLTDPPDGVPITFEEIQAGDSVLVCGIVDGNNYVLAHRIRVYVLQDCDSYDVGFRDTITAIDYAAGTFIVANRTETITVDDNTLIWGNMIVSRDGGTGISGRESNAGICLERRTPFENPSRKIVTVIYEFSDLQVGDVVEVRADIVNPDTLLALKIKIANCSYKKTVDFTGYIATIDASIRVVTFQEMAWIAVVCPGAELTDVDGQPLTLDDFSVGDMVAVKGFPLDTDALQICEMQSLEYQ